MPICTFFLNSLCCWLNHTEFYHSHCQLILRNDNFYLQVKDAISHKFNYFYTKKAETHKSDWLKMIQAPHGNQDHNFTAYNTEKGVCYEAINHISAGEELLVLFQEDKLGVYAQINTVDLPMACSGALERGVQGSSAPLALF